MQDQPTNPSQSLNAGAVIPVLLRPGGTADGICTNSSRMLCLLIRPSPPSAATLALIATMSGPPGHSLAPMLSMFWKLSVLVPNRCRRSVLDLSESTFIRIGPDTRLKPVSSSTQAGAKIPWVVEAWAHCARSQQKGQGNVKID